MPPYMSKDTEELETFKFIQPPIDKFKNSNFLTRWIEEKLDFKTKLIWPNIIAIGMLHLVAIYACISCIWKPITVFYGFFVGFICGFGITGGVHRYWCHRGYKANLPLRIILMLSFTMTGQNNIFNWVRDHRAHHKFSDTDADPHNSKRGFFFSHVGWLLMKRHPEVIRKGKEIDMSDILQDPIVQFHLRYFIYLKLIVGFIIPTIIPVYAWDERWLAAFFAVSVCRYVYNLNCTWLVNSLAHYSGNKPYNRNHPPSENKVVSFLALGEGWHNYHHSFPWDYKASELGNYSLNATTFWIDLFAKIGWAYDLRQPSKEMVKRLVLAKGDGSHPYYSNTVEDSSNCAERDEDNKGY